MIKIQRIDQPNWTIFDDQKNLFLCHDGTWQEQHNDYNGRLLGCYGTKPEAAEFLRLQGLLFEEVRRGEQFNIINVHYHSPKDVLVKTDDRKMEVGRVNAVVLNTGNLTYLGNDVKCRLLTARSVG